MQSNRHFLTKASRLFSSNSNCAFKERFSEFIYKSLYDKQAGYFRRPENIQLGRLQQPIDFSALFGYDAYTKELNSRYPKSHFLTPSEIFRPFYGMTSAKFLLERASKLKVSGLRIVEIGTGLGGHADSLLCYLKNNDQEAYNSVNYKLVEISETLIESSRNILTANHSSLIKKGQIQFVNLDALHFKESSQEFVFILLFEVLDNLAHQKVCFDAQISNPTESWIVSSTNRDKREELFEPLADTNAMSLLQIWKELYFKDKKIVYDDSKPFPFIFSFKGFYDIFKRSKDKLYWIYLPTAFFKLVKHYQALFPNSELLISDFSTLPVKSRTHKVTEIYKPIVSTKKENAEDSIDYSSPLEPPFGSADIFFPSDFDFIKKIVERVSGKAYQINTPKEYFGKFAEESWAKTRSSFNPMHEDFSNTRFLFRK